MPVAKAPDNKELEKLTALLESPDIVERFDCYVKLVNAWLRRDAKIALRFAEDWQKLAIDHQDSFQQILSGNKIHIAYLYLGDKARARTGLKELLKRAEQEAYIEMCSAIANNLAISYQNDDRETHLAFLLKAIGYSRQCNHLKFLAIQLSNYGNAMSTQGDQEKAMTYFEESQQIALEQEDQERIMWNHLYIGGCQIMRNELEKSQNHLEAASNLNKTLKHQHFQSQLSIAFLELYSAQERYQDCLNLADSLLEKEEAKLKRMHRKRTLMMKGHAHLKLKQYVLAEQYLLEARQLIDAENHLDEMIAIEDLEQLALRKGEHKKAYELLQERLELQGALHDIKTTEAIARMRVEFDAERKEQENEALKVKVAQAEKIESQNRQLQQLNDTKDKFFGIIAHDIRSPIVALEGVGEQMQYYLKKGKQDKLLKLSDRIDSTARRLSRLLDNLLNWALLQQGVIPYHPESIPIRQTAEETIGMFEQHAALKNIQLRNNIADSIIAFADPSSLQTIFRNLLSNAIKFTPVNGEVYLSASEHGEEVKISFKDSGVGISEEKLQDLFSLNAKSQKGTAGERGTGLGLSLVQELIKLNKGHLAVESRLQIGSIFSIHLPEASKDQKNSQ